MDTKKKDQSTEEQLPSQNEDQGQGSAWEQNPEEQQQQPETGSLGGEATYEESGEDFYSDMEESDIETGNEPQQNQTQGGAGSLKENYDMDEE